MKFVIPNPTYPAVDTPVGYSTLADSISVIHNKSFGVVPNKQIYKDFIEDTIGVSTFNIISRITTFLYIIIVSELHQEFNIF